MPFASCILPLPNPSEILSILIDINATLPPSKRLPKEMLLQIRNEVHRPGTIWEDIHSTWTAIPANDRPDLWPTILSYTNQSIPLVKARLDPNLMKYKISENPSAQDTYTWSDGEYTGSIQSMFCHMSSADLLYRVRCFFPHACIDSSDGYKGIWTIGLRHNQTGFGLGFSEFKAGATLRLDLNPGGKKIYRFRINEQTGEFRQKLDSFSTDAVRLLNAFIETVDTDDGPQLAFFHPAARATHPSSDLRYIAVPELARKRIWKEDRKPYRSWSPVQVSASDLPPLSPFRSLLPDLKYDVESRKIDLIKGTIPLTEVISSALLYYRLLCKYPMQPDEIATTIQDSGSSAPPISNSVWQMELSHKGNRNALILITDDRGLFDIRANEDAMKVKDDIVSLLNSLCSDDCTHPYDGTVAGCVA